MFKLLVYLNPHQYPFLDITINLRFFLTIDFEIFRHSLYFCGQISGKIYPPSSFQFSTCDDKPEFSL
jgi:hypothetical protein